MSALRLAFVHASYQVQLRQASMSNLAVLQGLGKYPDHLRAAGEGSVGSRAHQPNGGSPVRPANLRLVQVARDSAEALQ
jgi:hypothetical protein